MFFISSITGRLISCSHFKIHWFATELRTTESFTLFQHPKKNYSTRKMFAVMLSDTRKRLLDVNCIVQNYFYIAQKYSSIHIRRNERQTKRTHIWLTRFLFWYCALLYQPAWLYKCILHLFFFFFMRHTAFGYVYCANFDLT